MKRFFFNLSNRYVVSYENEKAISASDIMECLEVAIFPFKVSIIEEHLYSDRLLENIKKVLLNDELISALSFHHDHENLANLQREKLNGIVQQAFQSCPYRQ
jgi:hypothetical protein